jgi:DHA2 family multidrug resistance protein-like MFS transporter
LTLSNRDRNLALIAVSIGTFVSTLSQTIANIALPTIGRDLHVSAATSVWVVNGTQLATTATLLFFAALGDARGAKAVYLSGLAVFTVATLGCAFAPSFEVLVALRVLQGLGGSALIVTTNSLTRALYPPHEIGRSVAINSMFVAFGTAAGPTLGGIILSFADWHWIFALNVPLALVSLVLGLRFLPKLPASGAKLDYTSGALAAAGFGGIIYAIDGVARHMALGEAAAIVAVGAIAMTLFVRRQLHLEHPLMAVELFRVPIFSVAVLASTATYTAQGLAYVSLPFFFQSVLGHSPLVAGLLLSAWPVMALLVAVQMGPLSDRYSASLLCTIGILVMGVGLAAFALLPAAPATWMVVACAALGGAGFATFQTPNNRAIIATAPPHQTGRAAGVMSAARLSGQTGGAALVALIFELVGGATGAHAVPVRGLIEATLLTACGFIAFAAVMSVIRWNAGRTVAVAG